MSDFVYDNTSLPYPKSDKAALDPLEDPTKNVVASDWNSACQASVDVRSAILSGKYWGLNDNAATAGSAGGFRLRSQNARPQVSVGGGSYQGLAQHAAGRIDPRDYGAKCDGTTDDLTALQNAVNATGAGEVFVPPGTTLISGPLNMPSGVRLIGVRNQSILKSSGAAGTAVIQMQGDGTTCQHSVVENLRIKSTNSGLYAIKGTATDVLNCAFRNLIIDTTFGLDLATYTQDCQIDTIHSLGNVDQVLHLKGNFNKIRRINKDGGSGTSTDPYILIEAHGGGPSADNELDGILIEGTTSANKYPIKLSGCSGAVLRNYWWEPTASNGFALFLSDCEDVTRLEGVQTAINSSEKIRVSQCGVVLIKVLDTDALDESLAAAIQFDDTYSIVQVDTGRSRRASNFPISAQLRVRSHEDRVLFTDQIAATAPAGYLAAADLSNRSAGNLLVNPSFEAGSYGWSWSGAGAPDSIEAPITSDVGPGNMLHVKWTALAGQRVLYQAFTVPAGMVGVPITFSALVKITGAGFVCTSIGGAGVADSTNYNRVEPGKGWCRIFQTIVPQSAGTLDLGFNFINLDGTSDAWVDEASAAFGTLAECNTASFGSMELGGKTQAVASAAPTTGTWAAGAIVWNSAPTAGGKVGWVCTSGGSPGTWKAFGVIDA